MRDRDYEQELEDFYGEDTFEDVPMIEEFPDSRQRIAEASAIEPAHYRKGDIDLYEAAYLTRPFNEVRAILEFTAERYIKRDKKDRVEDLRKAAYTIERLIGYEEMEAKK